MKRAFAICFSKKLIQASSIRYKMKTINYKRMKTKGTTLNQKKTLILSMLILLSMAVFSQVNYSVKVAAGGACQSELFDIAKNCDARFGYSVGANISYDVSDNFALRSGLFFQQKGRDTEFENQSLKDKNMYTTLPIQAVFSAGRKAGFYNGQRIYLAIGPYLSYLLDAERQLNQQTIDTKDDMKSMDAGLALELGFQFKVLKEKAVQIGLNYDMGFTEVYKHEENLHNKFASLSLAYLF